MKKLTTLICILFLSACNNLHSEKTQLITIPANNPHITTMGRTHINNDQSVTAGFPGVSFFIETEGEKLSVDIKSSQGNSWIDVIVDNQPAKLFKISSELQTLELFSFSTSAKHKVRITHRSENWHGNLTLQQFRLTGKKFLNAPKLPERKLMILGDSVTCGEAIDRVAGEQKHTVWWNARESYGLLTTDALDAQVHLVCWGGRGLIRSWNGKTDEANLPDFFEFAVGDNNPAMKWNHDDYQPDAIVIAIGTNDFSPGIPDRETYVRAYVNLLKKLLILHPQAQILLIEGSILNGENKNVLTSYLAETKRRINNSRVHQGTSSYYPGDASDAHPTKEQHALMARELTEQLKDVMGW